MRRLLVCWLIVWAWMTYATISCFQIFVNVEIVEILGFSNFCGYPKPVIVCYCEV